MASLQGVPCFVEGRGATQAGQACAAGTVVGLQAREPHRSSAFGEANMYHFANIAVVAAAAAAAAAAAVVVVVVVVVAIVRLHSGFVTIFIHRCFGRLLRGGVHRLCCVR